MRPLENVDRASWLVLAGVAILAIAGVGATLLTSWTSPASDATTPLGVLTTYVRAIQAGDADRAWALTGPATTQPIPGQPPRPFLSENDFRQQLQSGREPTAPRIRILSTSLSTNTATFQLEVTHASGDPLTGASSTDDTLYLTREPDGWRITSDPYPGQVQ